jgi:hypothetical protein
MRRRLLTIVAGLLLIAAGVVASLTVNPQLCGPPIPPGMTGDQVCHSTPVPILLGVIGGVGGAIVVMRALLPTRWSTRWRARPGRWTT